MPDQLPSTSRWSPTPVRRRFVGDDSDGSFGESSEQTRSSEEGWNDYLLTSGASAGTIHERLLHPSGVCAPDDDLRQRRSRLYSLVSSVLWLS